MFKIIRDFFHRLTHKTPEAPVAPVAMPDPEGLSVAEISAKLGIPELADMIDSGREDVVVSVADEYEIETLRFRPRYGAYEGRDPTLFRAFELAIDIHSAPAKPALALSFQEMANGNYKIFGIRKSGHAVLDTMQVPTLGNPVIDSVTEMIWERTEKNRQKLQKIER